MEHYKSSKPNHLKYIEKLNTRNLQYSTKMFLIEEYTRAHDKLHFRCDHGHVTQVTAYSVTGGTGCAICSGKKKRTTGDYINYLNNNTKWTLVEGEKYINVKTKLKVKCVSGHIRLLSPDIIISQNIGCAICSKKALKTIQSFITELNIKRTQNNMQLVKIKDGQFYKNSRTKITFTCSKGHEWESTPSDILYQLSDCPYCKQRHYSKMAIGWLTQLEKRDGVTIQHAENGGEFPIPGTRFRADGYCADTNTIYEFHGNKFHGNLKIYKPKDNCHPFDRMVTALELYERTIRKEQIILDLGYNLIVKWED